jgi:hypothetical protein
LPSALALPLHLGAHLVGDGLHKLLKLAILRHGRASLPTAHPTRAWSPQQTHPIAPWALAIP